MKKIILILTGVALLGFYSCIDNDTFGDDVRATPNVVGFVDASTNLSGIADGSEYTFEVTTTLKGATSRSTTGTFTGTLTVDPSSTAIEGTHFRLDESTIEVSSDKNYLNKVSITMLSSGIVAPLDMNPVLKLNVENASGPGKLSGGSITINLLYLCPSTLAGTYETTITRDDGNVYVYSETVTETGIGEYRGESVGHWSPGAIGGTPGFDFIDVCDDLTVPGQSLVALYSNQVFQTEAQQLASVADPDNGKMHIEYSIPLSAGDRTYSADYVKQ